MEGALTILIAEDSEDDAFFLQRALKEAGLPNPTHVCPDGEDVIRYLQGTGEYADRQQYPFPRMLILDLKMPKKNGFDVLRWLQTNRDCSVIPTIILSASNEPQDVEQAYRLGANAYLVKPAPGRLGELVRCLHQFWTCCELPKIAGPC